MTTAGQARSVTNLLVEMENSYELKKDKAPLFRSVYQIYRKLDKEVSMFQNSVKDIMSEMQPIKDQIIT